MLLYILSLVVLVSADADFAEPQGHWEYCKKLPILDETCIEIDFNKTALELDIKLIINGHTFINKEIRPQICLDQWDLLKLIALIPVLAPFKKIIDGLVLALKFIPADVYKVCVIADDLQITDKQAKGCIYMDINLMCIKDTCLWKGEEDFGCFDIPI